MRKNINWWWFSFVFFIAFAIGVIVDKIVQNWPVVDFKNEIDAPSLLISVLTLGSTLTIAYWVTTRLEKEKETNRAAKDIFIKRLDRIYDIANDFSEDVAKREIDFFHTVATIKRISRNADSLFRSINKASINISNDNKSDVLHTLRKINELLTNTPPINQIHSGERPAVTIENNVIKFSFAHQSLLEVQFDMLNALFGEIELEINNF